MPGPRGRLAGLGGRPRSLDGRPPARRAGPREVAWRLRDRLRARDRRSSARLRRRPLRGLSGEDVRRAERGRARRLPRGERGRGPRRGGRPGWRRRRARQPPGDGARDPRPGGPSLRGQDPRLGARVHGEAGARALPAVCARGHGGGGGGAGRLAPHGGEPLGGDLRPGSSGSDPSWAPRRGHGALPAAGPRGASKERLAELAARVAGEEEAGGAFARDPVPPPTPFAIWRRPTVRGWCWSER